MARYFFDTSAYVGLIDRRDEWHAEATRLMRELARSPINVLFTSEAVLIELLTYFSNKGAHMRDEAVAFVERLRASETIIIPQTPALFDAALELYRRRRDKTYSMVDAISMVVCRQQGIADVLTADQDFAQEGLNALLA